MPGVSWRMSFRPFSSESYAEHDRPEAWRDVLSTVGLQPASTPTFYSGHATASRRNIRGVTLVKLAAASQGVAPLAGNGDDALPTALLAIEDGAVLRAGGPQIVPAGHLLLLPQRGDWTLQFQRDMRAIALHVTTDAFRGRKTGRAAWIAPRAVMPQGFAGLFARALEIRQPVIGRVVGCGMGGGRAKPRRPPVHAYPAIRGAASPKAAARARPRSSTASAR